MLHVLIPFGELIINRLVSTENLFYNDENTTRHCILICLLDDASTFFWLDELKREHRKRYGCWSNRVHLCKIYLLNANNASVNVVLEAFFGCRHHRCGDIYTKIVEIITDGHQEVID